LVINGAPQLIGYGVNLSNADLCGADLAGLDLSFVNAQMANLSFANLSGCNLSFADLTGADAIGADLRGATLRGAITTDMRLLGADLRGATYDKRTVRGAFICDELTPEYLAILGVPTPIDLAQRSADLLRDATEATTLQQAGSLAHAHHLLASEHGARAKITAGETSHRHDLARDQHQVAADTWARYVTASLSATPASATSARLASERAKNYTDHVASIQGAPGPPATLVDPVGTEDSLSPSEQAAELEDQISLLEAKAAAAEKWNDQLTKHEGEAHEVPVTLDQDGALADAPSARVSPLPTQPNESRGGRMRDYSELLEGLSTGIAELTTSEKWTQYLDVQSKFYRYSPSNAMLIMMQNENATLVAGYKKWKELGRQVMAKESALRILAPMTYKKDDGLEGEKASEIRGWKMVPVFDISQTEGPDLPDVVSKLEGLAPEGVFEKLTVFAQGIGFRVERPESLESGANGDTTHSEGRIRVVASNSEAQQAKTLAHEIGHALLHDPESPVTKDVARGLKELEAESCAYVICTALGMDTSDYSFGYVAGWAGDAPEALQGIKASTGRIQKAATAVLKTFEVEEPAVEATNAVSIEVAIERSRDVATELLDGERRTEDLVELERIQGIAAASDGRLQVISVDRSLGDTPASKYQPLSAAQLDVLDGPADTWRELGV
jgi:hypothetical protein